MARLISRLTFKIFLFFSLIYSLFIIYTQRLFYIENELVAKILLSSSTTNKYERRIPFQSYGKDFCVAYRVVTATKTFREDGLEPISLATHTTATYLKYVIEQVETYDGPISLAFFVDKNTEGSLSFLLNLYECDQSFSEKITLHIIFRRSPFLKICPDVTVELRPCENFTKTYKTKYLNRLIPPFGIYPINIVRNIARKGAQSYLQIIADIEMIFSLNFANEIKKIANDIITQESKQLIVLRRFELEEKVKHVPRTVEDLKSLFLKKKVFEFHHKLFPVGHTIPGLFDWFRRSLNSTLPTSWIIPYKGPAWEPQFIMHADAPMSEEFVPTRIRDHQALTFELCRANYKFHIISRHFNVHRGVKKESTHLDIAVKTHQLRLRLESRKKFLHRIEAMYPETLKICRNFTM